MNESAVSRWEKGKGILPKRLILMMGEEVVFHPHHSKITEGQLRALRAKWEKEEQ